MPGLKPNRDTEWEWPLGGRELVFANPSGAKKLDYVDDNKEEEEMGAIGSFT